MVDRSNRNPRSLANSEVFREGLARAAAVSDENRETGGGVVVFLVGLEVIGEAVDPLGEERDLHLGRAGVALVHLELLDQALLLVRRQPHAGILPGVPPPIATSPGPACGSVGTGS